MHPFSLDEHTLLGHMEFQPSRASEWSHPVAEERLQMQAGFAHEVEGTV